MTESELTESNENNNTYDEIKCPLCKQLYNEDIRIPRILLNCGHSICTNCISNSIKASSILKCPEDSTEYPNITSVSSFPINKALMKLVHKIFENKKQNDKAKNKNIDVLNNILNSSSEASPNKGLNTTRNSQKSIESLKLITLSSSKKKMNCNEHPNRKLEMICLEEICKICTNCAIFGKHKNHNVINIDEFIKDVESKAGKLIELFENINEGSIKKDLDISNEKSKDKLANLLKLINEKYNYMENVIHEFTQNLIEKVKKDENLLLNEIFSQFEKLKGRVNYYLELPNKINNNIKEWKEKVEDKMNALNEVKNISDECLKFVDCYGENLFNKLIKGGNNIISDVQKIISFPADDIYEEIKNLNLTIEKQILNQEFFHINKKLDFGDLCQKYEIPKKEEEKENSNMTNISKTQNNNGIKEVTHFGEKTVCDKINTCDDDITDNKINIKSNNDAFNNTLNLKQLNNNNTTQDTENEKSPINNDDKSNFFSQKEMELENIQFGDDSILFTDLDLIGMDLDSKNESLKIIPKIDGLPLRNSKKLKSLNPLDLCNNKLTQKNSDMNCLKPHKSIDNYNLVSHRGNTTYDRDSSFDTCLKKTPTAKKKLLKKTKSNIDFNRSPNLNKSKSKSKNKYSHKLSKDTKIVHDLSPFRFNKSNNHLKNLFKKSDKINLSRNELGEDIVLGLADQIKKNKDKVKEIKLIKCGIKDEGAINLLKAMEECQKLTSINLANNSLSDKVINSIISFLNKNYSITSCYFTNNNFSVKDKEKIKSYNRNGKIKIFV